jgi:hypothetical protein
VFPGPRLSFHVLFVHVSISSSSSMSMSSSMSYPFSFSCLFFCHPTANRKRRIRFVRCKRKTEKGKLPYVCCKRKQKTEVCFLWSANSYLTIIDDCCVSSCPSVKYQCPSGSDCYYCKYNTSLKQKNELGLACTRSLFLGP